MESNYTSIFHGVVAFVCRSSVPHIEGKQDEIGECMPSTDDYLEDDDRYEINQPLHVNVLPFRNTSE